MNTPTPRSATAQPPSGCTLGSYAAAKRLPEEYLRDLGLTDGSFLSAPALRVPYLDEAGVEVAVRFRLELQKGSELDRRFRWRKGDKARLYGLWRLSAARNQLSACTGGFLITTLKCGENSPRALKDSVPDSQFTSPPYGPRNYW